jgi:hypothetical protein
VVVTYLQERELRLPLFLLFFKRIIYNQMSTTPVAYNPSQSPIFGSEQIIDLAVGTTEQDYSQELGGVRWWMSPDQSDGYVIAEKVPFGDQPTAPGINPPGSTVAFWKTDAKTSSDFLALAQFISRRAGTPPSFSTADDAKTWLNANGYWTSYAGATGGGYELVILPYNPPAAGDVIFPNFQATPTPTQGNTNPNIFATGGVYWNAVDINSVDQSSYYNGLIGNSATITAILFDGPPGLEAFNYNPQVRPGQLTLTQASPSNFTVGQTVYISFTFT